MKENHKRRFTPSKLEDLTEFVLGWVIVLPFFVLLGLLIHRHI